MDGASSSEMFPQGLDCKASSGPERTMKAAALAFSAASILSRVNCVNSWDEITADCAEVKGRGFYGGMHHGADKESRP